MSHQSQIVLILVFSILYPGSPLLADQVFRCVQADGSLSFQHQLCAGEGEKLRVEPAVMTGWSELRSGEKALYKYYKKRDKQRYKRSSKTKTVARKTEETTVCWNKRKKMEQAEAKLRRGYKASQREHLHRIRDNNREYLALFCP